MRTSLFAGLVAGSVFLHSFAAIAQEGSSLRGLKPPRDAAAVLLGAEPLEQRGPGLRNPSLGTALELSPRISVYAGTLDTRDVTLSDTNLKFGVYRPLGSSTLLGQGTVNPLHDVIPKYTLYSQVSQMLPGGFGLGFGVRHSEYNFAAANLLALSAEGYVGSFRGAVTLYSNRTDTSGNGAAHRFQLTYLYGERNTVGLAYTAGRDIDNLNMPVGVPLGTSLADVRDWSLSGRHWLSPSWALTYDLQTQDSIYRRQGLRLGVSRSF